MDTTAAPAGYTEVVLRDPVGPGAFVFALACDTCAALVQDTEQHDAWHADINPPR